MKTINICKELNISPIEKIRKELAPDFIYIPVDDPLCLKVELNKKVYKEELVYDDGRKKIYSSISGKPIRIVSSNNKNYLIIKNNYKEESKNAGRARNLNKITKDTFLLCSTSYWKEILSNVIDTLYINAIDDDPYIYNKYSYLKDNMKDMFNFSKALVRLFNVKKIVFVIKNSYSTLLDKYKLMLLEYGQVSFQLVPNIYSIGDSDILSKYLKLRENDYLIDLSDIISCDFKVHKNKVETEDYISIYGNNIKNAEVLHIKKYSLLSPILENIKTKNKDGKIIFNNSLCGDELDLRNVISDDNIKGIFFNKEDEESNAECNKCGLCLEVCPKHINPLKKDNKCNGCGLCSYICPLGIRVYERNQR